jgi:hypothetical protein
VTPWFARTVLPEAVGPWTLWTAPPSAAGARADLATESPPLILSYLSSIPDATFGLVAAGNAIRTAAQPSAAFAYRLPAGVGGPPAWPCGSRRMRAWNCQRSGGWSPTRNPCR